MKAALTGSFFNINSTFAGKCVRYMYINPQNQLDKSNDRTTEKILSLLSANGTELKLKAGEAAVKEGQLCDFFFIVVSGSFRAYRLLNDREMIIGFSFKGDIDTAPYAFITNSHSTETIEAVTESTIIKIYRSSLEFLKTNYPEFKNFTEMLLAQYIEVLVKRHIEYKTYTAEQLYYKLYQRQPQEVKLIPLKYIASYLGISQERLSRIRSKANV
jgi:CRP-like cAMP-binding protein